MALPYCRKLTYRAPAQHHLSCTHVPSCYRRRRLLQRSARALLPLGLRTGTNAACLLPASLFANHPGAISGPASPLRSDKRDAMRCLPRRRYHRHPHQPHLADTTSPLVRNVRPFWASRLVASQHPSWARHSSLHGLGAGPSILAYRNPHPSSPEPFLTTSNLLAGVRVRRVSTRRGACLFQEDPNPGSALNMIQIGNTSSAQTCWELHPDSAQTGVEAHRGDLAHLALAPRADPRKPKY